MQIEKVQNTAGQDSLYGSLQFLKRPATRCIMLAAQ